MQRGERGTWGNREVGAASGAGGGAPVSSRGWAVIRITMLVHAVDIAGVAVSDKLVRGTVCGLSLSSSARETETRQKRERAKRERAKKKGGVWAGRAAHARVERCHRAARRDVLRRHVELDRRGVAAGRRHVRMAWPCVSRLTTWHADASTRADAPGHGDAMQTHLRKALPCALVIASKTNSCSSCFCVRIYFAQRDRH